MRRPNKNNPLCCGKRMLRYGTVGREHFRRYKCNTCGKIVRRFEIEEAPSKDNPLCPKCGKMTNRNGKVRGVQKYYCPSCKRAMRSSEVGEVWRIRN